MLRQTMVLLFFSMVEIACVIGQNSVTVVVPNVKIIKGNMMVCLVKDKADYLKDCYMGAETKVTATENITVFEEVPHGKYAVTIFHDKNEDKELNTNFIGIPKEPFGFSNNPSAMFGPPSFEKCLFNVESDQRITVRL